MTFGKSRIVLLRELRKIKNEFWLVQKELEELKKKLANIRVKSTMIISELGRRLSELKKELTEEKAFAEKLKAGLEEAVARLRKIKSPPNYYGIFLKKNNDGTADVLFRGNNIRVVIDTAIKPEELLSGRRVIVIGGLLTEIFKEEEEIGQECKISALLSNDRAKILMGDNQEQVVRIADFLKGKNLKVGDRVLADLKSGFILEILPKSGEVEEEIVLEELPNVKYEDVGGLDKEIESIKRRIEEPFLKPEIYARYRRETTKGVVLYGAPGCGKTMIAKAIAHSISERAKEKYGKEIKAHFFNIKGPEFSSKWVGETERQIRELFKKAKELAKKDLPVIIFFDEADSFLARRGSRISSDVNKDYVAQFCVEVDGVESLSHVIIILATNRIDLIDPAVLRPGRLDFKIRIKQPDEKGAKQILAKYLTSNLPLDQRYYDKNQDKYSQFGGDSALICNYFVEKVVERIFSEKEQNKFLEIQFERGRREVLRFKDFISGALLKNIVDRAKDKAIKEEIDGASSGIRLKQLYEAIEEEFKENEDLPSTLEAINEWAKIKGIKEEIVSYKFLVRSEEKKEDDDYKKII